MDHVWRVYMGKNLLDWVSAFFCNYWSCVGTHIQKVGCRYCFILSENKEEKEHAWMKFDWLTIAIDAGVALAALVSHKESEFWGGLLRRVNGLRIGLEKRDCKLRWGRRVSCVARFTYLFVGLLAVVVGWFFARGILARLTNRRLLEKKKEDEEKTI